MSCEAKWVRQPVSLVKQSSSVLIHLRLTGKISSFLHLPRQLKRIFASALYKWPYIYTWFKINNFPHILDDLLSELPTFDRRIQPFEYLTAGPNSLVTIRLSADLVSEPEHFWGIVCQNSEFLRKIVLYDLRDKTEHLIAISRCGAPSNLLVDVSNDISLDLSNLKVPLDLNLKMNGSQLKERRIENTLNHRVISLLPRIKSIKWCRYLRKCLPDSIHLNHLIELHTHDPYAIAFFPNVKLLVLERVYTKDVLYSIPRLTKVESVRVYLDYFDTVTPENLLEFFLPFENIKVLRLISKLYNRTYYKI